MSVKNDQKPSACGSAGSGPAGEADKEMLLRENMARIKHKIIVMSGKGGVGKSTVAVNLAVSLAEKKFRTGLLDVDVHGPSVPRLLGIGNEMAAGSVSGMIHPVKYNDFLSVMSVGFLMPDKDEAVIWRGPLKYSVIKQFLTDVLWGDLDYLIIDSPPGTGDEPLSVCQLTGDPDGAVIVTTPQDVALDDVRKSITFCRQLKLPVLGVVENMSGFTCPHCGTHTGVFKSGGGKSMADQMNVPFLGSIPIEPEIVISGDSGFPHLSAESGNATNAQISFTSIVESITKGERI